MGDTEGISGPWRATKLWNDIIRNFRSGMPLKKHKKNLRAYDNCFTSAEAIDWLHKNLQKNPNFGSEVTKDQTVQLLKKLYRAGIIENVKEESAEDEFRLSGELYRFSNKSPVRNLRTPGKENRKPLTDTANTPRPEPIKEKLDFVPAKPERDKSVGRKAKEEMKKQLNLSYFQALPSNSLIILDNDDIWRKVYMSQLSRLMTSKHTEKLDYAGQLDMDNVTHNMTKVSAKGIVQVDDKSEDLPHWVLSAMKCLANWPKQLRTVNGEDSCLPSYPGFENDVFNVVKDYFLGLQYPLTTCTLYEFLIEGYQKAEGKLPPPTAPKPVLRPVLGCNWKPGGGQQAQQYGYTAMINNIPICNNNKPGYQPQEEEGCFYKMTDSVEDFAQLSNQERVAKIKQTFQILPPLATSSLQNSNNTSSSLSGHTTFDAISYSSLSPGSIQPGSSVSPGTDAAMLLPPKTCYETAFVDQSPITRIVPQKEHEVLHIKRSWSGRSLIHIPTSDWATKSISTQTDQFSNGNDNGNSNSLKRLPRWKRATRFRKSIAVMETQKNQRSTGENIAVGITNHGFVDNNVVGITNLGFSDTPGLDNEPSVSMCPAGTGSVRRSNLRSESTESYHQSNNGNIRGYSSVDNLLDKEKEFEEEFMLKYRQVSGDLRGSCDLVQASRSSEDSRYFIQSKTVRKEKKKRRHRGHSEDKYGGYATDSEIMYDTQSRKSLSEVNKKYWHESPPRLHHSTHNLLERETSLAAPLAIDETVDLSPVPFARNNKYNNSYRMATNQPATPLGRAGMPRTSTKINLPKQKPFETHQVYHEQKQTYHQYNSRDNLEEIYSNGSRYTVYNPTSDSGISSYPGGGQPADVHRNRTSQDRSGHPARSSHFRRNTESRLSRCSQATVESVRSRCSQLTVDSGRYSHVTVDSDRYGHTTADSGRYSDASKVSNVTGGQRSFIPRHESLSAAHNVPHQYSQSHHQQSNNEFNRRTYQSMRNPPSAAAAGLRVLPASAEVPAAAQSAIRTLPPRVLTDRLNQLPQNAGRVEEYAINVFKLLTLLIPPSNRRKLQLLLKFIRKVSLNHELTLNKELSNREYSINIFTTVILRPSDPFATLPSLDRKIINLFIDKYEEGGHTMSPSQVIRGSVLVVLGKISDPAYYPDNKNTFIWSPAESLRREVEDKVYQSLVNRRLEAGEDPYPITYCKQVTKEEYEVERMTGAESGLFDLLEAMLVDTRMTEKEKIKKLKKFKGSHPQIWRRKFPSEGSEPEGVAGATSGPKINKFSSLSRIKNRIRM